MFMMIIMMMMI